MESKNKIDCLLSLTKIGSDRKIEALRHYFVGGLGVGASASMAGLPQPKLTEAIKILNKVAGACEKFHELKLHE